MASPAVRTCADGSNAWLSPNRGPSRRRCFLIADSIWSAAHMDGSVSLGWPGTACAMILAGLPQRIKGQALNDECRVP